MNASLVLDPPLPGTDGLLVDPPFVATIAEPAGGPATTGIIVLGMGMADVRVAKRLAKLGFLGVQMRLIKDSAHHNDINRRFATYDSSGVARCRHVMDRFERSHGVRRFVLMGNCALANIAFNTALVDQRVVGLILTNPHISKAITTGLLFKLRWHSRRWRSWLRLLRGQMRLRPAAGAQFQAGDRAEDLRRVRWQGLTNDILLPSDFDRRFEQLLHARSMQALLVFSEPEAGLEYFRRNYGQTLRRLVAAGRLRYEVVNTPVHDFSHAEDAARRINEIVAAWAETRLR
jgi:hypothetical protein